MIQANELRIGNLVNSKNDGIIYITNISEKNVAVIEAHCYNYIPINLISPIPITEEWYYKLEKQLIKSGFEYSHSKITNRLFIYIGNFTCQCSFIHQLQNLYFALTGAELTVA